MTMMNLKQVQHLFSAAKCQNISKTGRIERIEAFECFSTEKTEEESCGTGSLSSSSSDDDVVSSTKKSVDTASFCSSICEEQRRQAPPRRRVHFSAHVSQRNIPCVNDYSREEIERTWFLPEESFKIHQSCIKQIGMLERGDKMKGVKYCARGLESSTFQAQQAKKNNRRDAYDAVLDEQDEQHESDDFDEDAIAELYHEVSASCQMWAHVVAMQDQREAELIYDEGGIYDL